MTTTTLFGAAEAQTARELIGGTAIGDLRNALLKQILVATANRTGGSGGAAWGSITGTLSAQTDLQTALDARLLLSGGTMTGVLALTAGAVGAPALTFGDSTTGWYRSAANELAATISGVQAFKLSANGKFAFNYTNADAILGTLTSVYGTIAIRSDGAASFLVDKNIGALSGGDVLVFSDSGKLRFGISNDVILARKAAAILQMGSDAAGVLNQMFTAASRITSDGVGANLTIAGGNGRGGAGGSLILSTYDTGAAATIGTLTTRLTLDTNGLLTFADAVDMAFNTTTGTKIGTSATQKVGFWNATPVVQPATGGATSSFSVNTGTPVLEDSTWDGYTISVVIAALRNIGILA